MYLFFPPILVGMDPSKKEKKDSIYWVLRDTVLPTELIKEVKNFLPQEDWTRKNKDYFDDPYDHTFLKQFKNRMRNRSFSWPYYRLY